MKLKIFISALLLITAGCANHPDTHAEGCCDFHDNFQRYVEKRTSRREVERFMLYTGIGDYQIVDYYLAHGTMPKGVTRQTWFSRITTEEQLGGVSLVKVSPENLGIFRRYHRATYCPMECDNHAIVFFDDSDKIVGFDLN